MRTTTYTFICDTCSATIERPAETLPDNWRLVLIGGDHGPNKWEAKYHLCPDCAQQLYAVMQPGEISA